MLSIASLASGGESYYLKLAHEDYYTDGGEPPGHWWGRGAVRLGLSGDVERETLSRLFLGHSPEGTPLTRNAGHAKRCAGFDCTFSATKSVSVLFALAGERLREEIRRAHSESVHEALLYLEGNASFTRTGGGGEETQRCENLCVATFEHATSRALDPNLHTHALVLNFTRGADGVTRSLDGRELFRHKMAAGALYRAHLSGLLEERLGLRVRREQSWYEVSGVAKKVLTHFSKRREAILAALVDSGAIGTSAEAALAALETREAKDVVAREELFRGWQLEGKALGFSPKDLERGPRRERGDLAQAIEHALGGLLERQAHFSRRELLRSVAEGCQGLGVRARDIRQAVWAKLELAPEIVRLGVKDRERHYTTRAMYALEREMLERAGRLRQKGRHAVSEPALEAVIASRPTLSDEQERAVRHLTSAPALSVVSGMAGTGKSFLLGAVREAFARDGREVLGVCLAAIAAERLEQESGISSGTLHALLSSIERGKTRLTRDTVLVLDEAAMVGTRQMAVLLREIERAQAKLVLVGDERQLQAIEAGSPFVALGKIAGRAELTEIRRQQEEWAAEAVREFARGEAGAALARFAERELLVIEKSRALAMARLVSDWSGVVEREPKEALVLAGTNLEVSRLNRLCQRVRQKDGRLSGEPLRVGEEPFYEGDRVLFRKNSALVKNGSTGVVTEVLGEEGVLRVRLDSGERVSVDAELQVDTVRLGYAMTVHKAQGASVDRAFVLVGGAMQDREASYVQASRIRQEAKLYSDVWTAGEDAQTLVRSMARSREKALAHSLGPE